MGASRHTTTLELRADNKQALREVQAVQTAIDRAGQAAGRLTAGGAPSAGGVGGGGYAPGGGGASGPPLRSGGGSPSMQRLGGGAQAFTGAFAGGVFGTMAGSPTAGIGMIGGMTTAAGGLLGGALAGSRYAPLRAAGMGVMSALPLIGSFWSSQQRAAGQYIQLAQQRGDVLRDLAGAAVSGRMVTPSQSMADQAFRLGGPIAAGNRWGFRSRQAASMLREFSIAMGRETEANERRQLTGAMGGAGWRGSTSWSPFSIWALQRMGISTGAVASFMGQGAGAGYGGITGRGAALEAQIGTAWDAGLRGRKVDQWLQTIATATEGLWKQGVTVDAFEVARFTRRASQGLGMTGMRGAQFTATMMGQLGGARQQLLAPFAGLAQQAILAQAVQQGGSLRGAISQLQSMGPQAGVGAIRALGGGVAPEIFASLGLPMLAAQQFGDPKQGMPAYIRPSGRYQYEAGYAGERIVESGAAIAAINQRQIYNRMSADTARRALKEAATSRKIVADWGEDSIKYLRMSNKLRQTGTFLSRVLGF